MAFTSASVASTGMVSVALQMFTLEFPGSLRSILVKATLISRSVRWSPVSSHRAGERPAFRFSSLLFGLNGLWVYVSSCFISLASVEGSSEWISTKPLCVQFPTKTLCDASSFVSAQMKTALNARFRAVLEVGCWLILRLCWRL